MSTPAQDWLIACGPTLERFKREDAALCDAHVEAWENAPRCECCDSLAVYTYAGRFHPQCRACNERIHPEREASAGELIRAANWARRHFGSGLGD